VKNNNCGEDEPFWRTTLLEDMTLEQWESLCDGCGRCCLIKLEDEDDGDIYLTKLSCRLLDCGTCRCSDYANRHSKVPDCLAISPDSVREIGWLPSTCGYRRVAEGRDLAWWHPLVSGNPETVHEAGISVRSFARSEDHVPVSEWAAYIIEDFDEDDGPV